MQFKVKNILIAILCSLFFTQSVSAQFIDVVEQSLFYDAVQYFVTEVPILATDREEFNPLDKVTKAEYFKLLFESAGYSPDTSINDVPFHDVVGDEWFSFYVKKALDTGLIEFNEFDPNFNPGDTVNRCEAIGWILELYNIDTDLVKDYPNDYYDVPSYDACSDISKIAYILELLHDYKTHQFIPQKELTRAEAIHIFYKIYLNDFKIDSSAQSSYDYASIDDANFELFFQVWETVNNEYIDKDSIDQNQLIYGAITGMIAKLDDPYSVFFEPIDSTDFIESLEGNFDGIGIYISQEEDQFIVLTPLKGSPAEDADIRPGDIIIEIDDVSVQDLNIDELIDMLRGVPGTEVKLKIKRENTYYTKIIVRQHIEIPFVESEMTDNIGIIYYYQFTNNSHQQFETEIEKILSQNPKGLILDLRNNPGGYLYSAQELISRFIPQGESYINFIMADGLTYNETSSGPADLENIPLVILINEGSASASEIAALALKDKIGATIVGAPSYGKEKIQEILTFNDGSSLKLSIAVWSSPNGTSVAENGIQPDYNVQITGSEDTQLLKALQLIKL